MDTLYDKIFSSTKHNDTSLIKKLIGSQMFKKNSSSLFQNMPMDYQHQFVEDSLYCRDFIDAASSNAFQTNLHSIFQTFNQSMLPHIPKISSCSNLMHEYNKLLKNSLDTMVDSISDLNIVLNPLLETTMKENSTSSEVAPERSLLSDNLVVSIADASSPSKKTHFNVTISKTVIKPLSTPKKVVKEEGDFAQHMANRKTKELQKRSKKRRRRQKKANSSTASKDVQNHKIQVNCSASSVSAKEEENCDILCDLTLSHDSKRVQIVLPNLSSFVVTLESGDDDSDWDTNSEASWITDDSEFQVSGLFVASFSATNACSPLTYEPNNKDQDEELRLMNARLKEVNRIWNERHVCLKSKPKSSTLVSFADDEELEEICPVEIYDRKGEWEVFATERLRFKKRISELEEILHPCLLPDHRAKVYSTLYENNL